MNVKDNGALNFIDSGKFTYINDNNDVVVRELFMEVKDFAKAFNITFNGKFKIYDFMYVPKELGESGYRPEISDINELGKRDLFDMNKNSNIITTILTKDFLSLEVSQGTSIILKNGFEVSDEFLNSRPFLLELNDRVLMYVPVERLLNILKYDRSEEHTSELQSH